MEAFAHSVLMTSTDKSLAIIKSHLISNGSKLFAGILRMPIQGDPM